MKLSLGCTRLSCSSVLPELPLHPPAWALIRGQHNGHVSATPVTRSRVRPCTAGSLKLRVTLSCLFLHLQFIGRYLASHSHSRRHHRTISRQPLNLSVTHNACFYSLFFCLLFLIIEANKSEYYVSLPLVFCFFSVYCNTVFLDRKVL